AGADCGEDAGGDGDDDDAAVHCRGCEGAWECDGAGIAAEFERGGTVRRRFVGCVAVVRVAALEGLSHQSCDKLVEHKADCYADGRHDVDGHKSLSEMIGSRISTLSHRFSYRLDSSLRGWEAGQRGLDSALLGHVARTIPA